MSLITKGLGVSTGGSSDLPTITNIFCTSYTPTFNQLIEITATITNVTLNSVYVSINGISRPMIRVSGNTYTSEFIPAGTFGLLVNDTITIIAFKSTNGTKKADTNTISIIADNTKRFKEARNIELSLIQYLETQLSLTWSEVNLVKGFFNDIKKPLPVITVRLTNPTNFRKEVGTDILKNKYLILIDIFAESDGERLDLTSFVTDTIISGCTYYEYSKTINNKDTIGTANGRIIVEKILSNFKLEMYEEALSYEQHRQSISFLVSKS